MLFDECAAKTVELIWTLNNNNFGCCLAGNEKYSIIAVNNLDFQEVKIRHFIRLSNTGGSRNLSWGPNQGPQSKVKGEARIKGAKRPSIEGEARVEGAKRPRIEGEAQTEGEAREKAREGSGEGAW